MIYISFLGYPFCEVVKMWNVSITIKTFLSVWVWHTRIPDSWSYKLAKMDSKLWLNISGVGQIQLDDQFSKLIYPITLLCDYAWVLVSILLSRSRLQEDRDNIFSIGKRSIFRIWRCFLHFLPPFKLGNRKKKDLFQLGQTNPHGK